jgi:hypothetical protein
MCMGILNPFSGRVPMKEPCAWPVTNEKRVLESLDVAPAVAAAGSAFRRMLISGAAFCTNIGIVYKSQNVRRVQ